MSDIFQNINFGEPSIQKLVLSLFILLAAFLLAALLRAAVLRYIHDAEHRYRAAKGLNRTITVLAIITLLAIWSPNFTALVTVLTVLGTGLAIAMRESVLSFVAWMDIVFRHPYEQGDRIEINGVKGDVIDIRVLHTTLMEVGNWVDGDQSTGRLMHIPNNWIFRYALQNYTHGFSFIWNELSVTVTFQSDWQTAREIMLSIAEESSEIVEEQASKQLRQLAQKYLVHYSLLSPFVYVRVVENGIKLTLRYLCEVRKRRGTAHAFTLTILETFAENDQIELAYPTYSLSSIEGPQFGPVRGQQHGNQPPRPDGS